MTNDANAKIKFDALTLLNRVMKNMLTWEELHGRTVRIADVDDNAIAIVTPTGKWAILKARINCENDLSLVLSPYMPEPDYLFKIGLITNEERLLLLAAEGIRAEEDRIRRVRVDYVAAKRRLEALGIDPNTLES